MEPQDKQKAKDGEVRPFDALVMRTDAKRHFIIAMDGVTNATPPMFYSLNTFILGVTNLDYEDGELHVWLRRPGLLIGKQGRTLDAVEKRIGVKIKIHEVNLI